VTQAGRGQTTYQYFDEERTRKAVEYLREGTEPRERPFAAVLGFTLPHCPFIAPRGLYDYYAERVDVPEVEKKQPETVRRFRELRGILEPLPEERVRVARAAYYGLCEHFDSLIGQVLGVLDSTGLAENTLVIYTTDHGEMAGDHGCWWKSNYYEGSVGVPLIARLPGVIAPGAVSDAVCGLMDLGPTLAELAGADLPDTDGRSLWPTLQGQRPEAWNDETFSELCDRRGGFLASRMVRSGKWKLWAYADDEGLPPALFDLEDDPDELNDLGRAPEHADIREELLDRIHRNWDPEMVRRETAQATRDYDTLAKWGGLLKPPCPDIMPVPPPSYEANVELL